jgi:hypothetical protein
MPWASLALDHTTTERLYIGIVCAGINPQVLKALSGFLAKERRMSIEQYLRSIVEPALLRGQCQSAPAPPFGSPEEVTREGPLVLMRSALEEGPSLASRTGYGPMRRRTTSQRGSIRQGTILTKRQGLIAQ